jgi:hypothetical protein
MWLLDTTTERLHPVQFYEPNLPEYAILSHTWGDDEVNFQDIISSASFTTKKGWGKIQKTCAFAQASRIRYAWVDTCCIDKTSSAELSEAINSMFHWYGRAKMCYVYLQDFSPPLAMTTEPWLKDCRWFTRGWTLQELIAPRQITFYDKSWAYLGTKNQLCPHLSRITGIPAQVLQDPITLGDYSAAAKMSWAAKRTTTRIEDMAYCLLGLFDINMPLLYGERGKAFQRLQEEIVKNGVDSTLLAWQPIKNALSAPRPFATSPNCFANTGNVESGDMFLTGWSAIPGGLQMATYIWAVPVPDTNFVKHYCSIGTRKDPRTKINSEVCIALNMVGPDLYVRAAETICAPPEDDGTGYMKSGRGFTIAKMQAFRTPNHYTVQLSPRLRVHRAVPAGHWDGNTGRLFTPVTSNTNVLLIRAKDVEGDPKDFFVLIHEHRASRDLQLYLFSKASHPGLASKAMSEVHSSGISWENLQDEIPEVKDLSNTLFITFSGGAIFVASAWWSGNEFGCAIHIDIRKVQDRIRFQLTTEPSPAPEAPQRDDDVVSVESMSTDEGPATFDQRTEMARFSKRPLSKLQ